MSNIEDFVNNLKQNNPIDAMDSLEKELDSRVKHRIDDMRNNVSELFNQDNGGEDE